MRQSLGSAAVAALVMGALASAAGAQTSAKPAGGSVCSAIYTTTTDPARRTASNSGAAVLIFGSGIAATLYTWRGSRPYDKPPTELKGFDYQYQLTLTPTPTGYETTFSSLVTGTTVDLKITNDGAGNWMIGMLPRTAGSTTATGKLRCGSKPFQGA